MARGKPSRPPREETRDARSVICDLCIIRLANISAYSSNQLIEENGGLYNKSETCMAPNDPTDPSTQEAAGRRGEGSAPDRREPRPP